MKKASTPTSSPLHRGRDEREKALQCNNGACPPPFQEEETNARKLHNATMQRVLPLCKGELEGVVENHKSKIINLK